MAFDRLASCFSRFQGIGRRTAERLVFDILHRWDQHAIAEFAAALQGLSKGIVVCPECRTHTESLPCPLCSEERKNVGVLCVVSSSKDVYAIDAIGQFSGTYFVLNGLLSPLDNRGVESLGFDGLKCRIEKEKTREVIFAIDSSLEGDATIAFLREELRPNGLKLSRIASGVPVGTTLESVDRGTLSRAFSGRQEVGASL